jgi:LysM repeat protein
MVGALHPPTSVAAVESQASSAQSSEVTAFDLILAMNTLRTSYGNSALVEDPIIMAVAQSTAEIMAANQMSWHIGDVDGRLAAAGFGGGSKVWATENFAVGNHSIDEIMLVWSDESHMLPAVNPAYCNVGAGVAKSGNGLTYYVLQAAYVAGKSCGDYTSPGGISPGPGGGTGGVSQLIVPVKIATPDAEGKVFHVVEAGQSFWAIAVAYKITIRDLEIWNNISRDSGLQIGQVLFIPGSNTEGYATPTPVGMVQISSPDRDGRIIHTVQAYQTLTTISQAYDVQIQAILSLNGIQLDWPLQIGQKLLVDPGNITPSPTPRPLSPIEKLTPASDGKLYHVVQSGETLSWIAGLYEVDLADLMVWNGLSGSSIIQPGQKLLLQVTPPATETPTPGPAIPTASSTMAQPTSTPTRAPTQPALAPAAAVGSPPENQASPVVWFVSIGLAAGGLFLAVYISRRRSSWAGGRQEKNTQ